jgi:RNA polymerase sigma-70 factor (ECF subfamily)
MVTAHASTPLPQDPLGPNPRPVIRLVTDDDLTPSLLPELTPTPLPPGAPAAAPSEALVEACRLGDRRALQTLLQGQARGLERFIRRLVGPTAEVPDLLQTVFLEAIRSFPRFRGDAPVKSWLQRITVHVCYDHLRRRQHRQHQDLDALAPSYQPVDPARPADDQLETRRQLDRLAAVLDALPARRRMAFVLHVIEGLPVAEVAGLVGATSIATRSRIFWARRELESRLARDPLFAGWLQGLGGADGKGRPE